MKFPIFILVLALGACSGQQQAFHQTTMQPSGRTLSPQQAIGSRNPALDLRVFPRQGFAPLRVTFHAVLQGVAESDSNYKCLYQEWNFGDGRVSGEHSDCKMAETNPVDLDYLTDHVFEAAGTYTVRFRLGDNTLVSKEVSVVVLDSIR
jgi:FOG: PKD repeat